MALKIDKKWKPYIIGYILVFVWNISNTSSAITAQLAMSTTAVFELAFIWNVYSIICATVILLILRNSLRIATRDIYKIVIFSILDYIILICSSLACVFNPVGNNEGVYICLFILFTTVVDLIRKRVNKKIIASAILAIAGTLMLVQPWRFREWNSMKMAFQMPCKTIADIAPHHNYTSQLSKKCDVIISNSTEKQTVTNYLQPYMQVNESCISNLNISIADNSNASIKTSKVVSNNNNRRTLTELGLYAWIGNSKYSELYGYSLTTIGALGDSVNSNLGQNFMESYSGSSLIFWSSVVHLVLSFILTFSLHNFPGLGGWTLPNTGYCFILTFLYTIFTSMLDVSEYYSYDFLPISHTAILRSFSILILYICQRTFLFNDGNANVLEVFGAIFAFCSIVLTPVVSLITHREKEEEEIGLLEKDTQDKKKHKWTTI